MKNTDPKILARLEKARKAREAKNFPVLYQDDNYEITCDDLQYIVKFKDGKQNNYYSDLDVMLKKIFTRELKLLMKVVGDLRVMKEQIDLCMAKIERIANSIGENF
jgi:hypothetical protein